MLHTYTVDMGDGHIRVLRRREEVIEHWAWISTEGTPGARRLQARSLPCRGVATGKINTRKMATQTVRVPSGLRVRFGSGFSLGADPTGPFSLIPQHEPSPIVYWTT